MKRNLKKVMIILLSAAILMGCTTSKEADKDIKGNENLIIETNEEILEESEESKEENIEEVTDQKNEVALETNLDEDDTTMFEKANGWTNGYMFDCTWRADNVTFGDGIMKLTIDSDGDNVSPKWSGGEYRTRKFYSYGLFEVKMKPIKNNGVVSSFFTYTGPSDNNPWDEIDIEFLGKDTTKIQFNYFTNSIGEHEYVHDLGFDASTEFHTYGFEWLPDSITWYVDGEAVYTATENIPSTPSKLMMNVWPGVGVDGWLNAYDGTIPLSAEYDWIRVTQYDLENK